MQGCTEPLCFEVCLTGLCRAEATDVANAVLDGVDGMLLGAETLRGKYAVDTVRTVLNICRQAELAFDYEQHFDSMIDSAMDVRTFFALFSLWDSCIALIQSCCITGNVVHEAICQPAHGGNMVSQGSVIHSGPHYWLNASILWKINLTLKKNGTGGTGGGPAVGLQPARGLPVTSGRKLTRYQ